MLNLSKYQIKNCYELNKIIKTVINSANMFQREIFCEINVPGTKEKMHFSAVPNKNYVSENMDEKSKTEMQAADLETYISSIITAKIAAECETKEALLYRLNAYLVNPYNKNEIVNKTSTKKLINLGHFNYDEKIENVLNMALCKAINKKAIIVFNYQQKSLLVTPLSTTNEILDIYKNEISCEKRFRLSIKNEVTK